MKKFIKIIIISICILPSICYADNIYNIDMDVYIDKDGTASIREVWNVKANNGSEWNKTMYNLGNSILSNYTVTMDGKELLYKQWDTNESMALKTGYYGINNTDKGIELCFGKSDYKSHTFIIKYELSNFIFNTTDYQVLYFTLIPDISVNDFNIEVTGYYSFPDTLDVWGYGYQGYTFVKDGKINMSNKDNLENDKVVLLVRFPKDTFNTANTYSEYPTFDKVINKAKENNYQSKDTSKNLILLIVILSIFILTLIAMFSMLFTKILNFINYKLSKNMKNIFYILLFIILCTVLSKFSEMFIYLILIAIFLLYRKIKSRFIYGYQDNKKINKKEVLTYRDIPCNKDIYYANSLVNLNCYMNELFYNYKEINIFGAIILKWLKEDKIEIINVKPGVFNRKTSKLDLRLSPVFDNDKEKLLFNYMYSASNDGVLEPKELEKWCKKNYRKFLLLFDDIKNNCIDKLKEENKISEKTKEDKCRCKNVLNDELYEESKKLYGLYKYFEKFTKINKKEEIEIKLWEEYLMYAYIFGLADKVLKQLNKLYPELLDEFEYDYNTLLFVNNLTYIGFNTANNAKNRISKFK